LTLVGDAVPIDGGGKNVRLRRSLSVTGRDGYAVALSFGELDPDFEGKQIVLAYAKDGKALETIQLVVPGDRRGGRAVRDVVSVDVR
jgi:hypothetical protein